MATKTWRVDRKDVSRHPQLDGETVDMYEYFSNGQKYPGDFKVPNEAINCHCSMDVDMEVEEKLDPQEWKETKDKTRNHPFLNALLWALILKLGFKSDEEITLKSIVPWLGPHYHPHAGEHHPPAGWSGDVSGLAQVAEVTTRLAKWTDEDFRDKWASNDSPEPLKKYLRGDYNDIITRINKGMPLNGEMKDRIQELDEIIDKGRLPDDVFLHRKIPRAAADRLKVGDTPVSLTWSNWSLDPDDEAGDVLVKIVGKRGSSVGFGKNGQIILPRNLQFFIAEKNDGGIIMELRAEAEALKSIVPWLGEHYHPHQGQHHPPLGWFEVPGQGWMKGGLTAPRPKVHQSVGTTPPTGILDLSDAVDPLIAMQRVFKDVNRDDLTTSDEDDAINYYTSNGYNLINAYLRHGVDSPGVESAVRNIDSAIAKNKLHQATVLWRATNKELNNGDTLNDKGYSSFSVQRGGIKFFSRKHPEKRGNIRIVAPIGTQFAVGDTAESELILPRDSSYKIGEWHQEGDYGYWDAEIVKTSDETKPHEAVKPPEIGPRFQVIRGDGRFDLIDTETGNYHMTDVAFTTASDQAEKLNMRNRRGTPSWTDSSGQFGKYRTWDFLSPEIKEEYTGDANGKGKCFLLAMQLVDKLGPGWKIAHVEGGFHLVALSPDGTEIVDARGYRPAPVDTVPYGTPGYDLWDTYPLDQDSSEAEPIARRIANDLLPEPEADFEGGYPHKKPKGSSVVLVNQYDYSSTGWKKNIWVKPRPKDEMAYDGHENEWDVYDPDTGDQIGWIIADRRESNYASGRLRVPTGNPVRYFWRKPDESWTGSGWQPEGVKRQDALHDLLEWWMKEKKSG